MILQQAWSLCLRDRITGNHSWGLASSENVNNNSNRAKISEPCRRFNRGKCNFGTNCKYEHKCSYCFKYGHGSVNCHKAQGDRRNINGKQQFQNRRESHTGSEAMHGEPKK